MSQEQKTALVLKIRALDSESVWCERIVEVHNAFDANGDIDLDEASDADLQKIQGLAVAAAALQMKTPAAACEPTPTLKPAGKAWQPTPATSMPQKVATAAAASSDSGSESDDSDDEKPAVQQQDASWKFKAVTHTCFGRNPDKAPVDWTRIKLDQELPANVKTFDDVAKWVRQRVPEAYGFTVNPSFHTGLPMHRQVTAFTGVEGEKVPVPLGVKKWPLFMFQAAAAGGAADRGNRL